MARLESRNRLRLPVASLAAMLLATLILQAGQAPAKADVGPLWLELERVGVGFTEPVHVGQAPDGSSPLVVAERAGRILVVEGGEALDTPFLDLSGNVSTATFEQGMFSVAFHPNYASNGYVYVTYSPTPNEWRLERYTVSEDPNRLDAASAVTLLSIDHPGETHYGGQLQFGPDGYLWVSVGDGGGLYGQYGDAQDLTSLLGKVLRIDVDGASPYAIPVDNPFLQQDDARPEIWAYGLRNPWRFSFDSETGDLYIADVGEVSFEEINVEPAGSGGGRNYGWPLMEGSNCTPVAPDCDPSGSVQPTFAYGRDQGCSVIGGYVYRASQASPAWGTYIFSDFCNGTISTLNRDDGGWHAEVRLPTVLNVSSFGIDAAGDLLLVDFTQGSIYRVKATTDTPEPVSQRIELDVPLDVDGGESFDIRGWNFLPDAQTRINGVPFPTARIDSTWLTVDLTNAPALTDGIVEITVANGDVISAPLRHDIMGRIRTRRAFHERWARTDQPVAELAADRTWMWGPEPFTGEIPEPYAESDDESRIVVYYDKSRLEVTRPAGNPEDLWYVTNGLLVMEMVTGELQVGDTAFETRAPAAIGVAGDPDDADGPTYATLAVVLNAPPLPDGASITSRIDRNGNVTNDPLTIGYGATAAQRVSVPGINHQIASPFWSFMNASGVVHEDGELVNGPLFINPFYATGNPITEAYWTTVRVAGTPTDVLIQCFERRCLTWTPSNPAGWQVEAGNVGRHYYAWRYGE